MFNIKKVFSFFIAVNFAFFSGISTSLAGIEDLIGYSHESAARANPSLVRYFYESHPQRLRELGGQEQLDAMILKKDFLKLSGSEHFQLWIDKIFMSSLEKNSKGLSLPVFSWVWGMPQDLNLHAMYSRSSYLQEKVGGYFDGFLSVNEASEDPDLKLRKEKLRYRLIQDIILISRERLDIETINVEPTELEHSVSLLLSKDRTELVHFPRKALTPVMTFQILDTTFSGEYLEIAKYLLANPLQLDVFGNLAGHILSIPTNGGHLPLLEGTTGKRVLVPSVEMPSEDLKPAVHLQNILIALQMYIGANKGKNIHERTLRSFASYLIKTSSQNAHRGDTSFLESLQVLRERLKPATKRIGSGHVNDEKESSHRDAFAEEINCENGGGAVVDDSELEGVGKRNEGKPNPDPDNMSAVPTKAATPNNTGESFRHIGYSLLVIVPAAILGGILYLKFKGSSH